MTISIGEMLQDPAQYWYWTHRFAAQLGAIHAAQETALFDHIGAVPRSAQDIAAAAGLRPDATRRVLEFLAAEGVLDVDSEGCFSATERSDLLRANGSVAWIAGAINKAALSLGASLADEAGRDAWTLAYGKDIFEDLAVNPELGRNFGEAMGFHTRVEEPRIFASHDFEPFELAVDVGGSHGTLLMRLLADHPSARGIAFDLPETAEQARGVIAAAGMANRIEAAGGSFFEAVPEGGDLYLLKHILHDWSDDECVAILKTIRAAMRPGGRLAVLERIVPAEYAPDIAFAYDIVMLLCTSGRERRVADFERLFAESGFRLDRVTQNTGGVSVIEALPV